MSTYGLDTLFAPRSVAVVGGSPRKTSSGRAVLENLRRSGFPGAISLVNPHYDEIEGVRAVKSLDDLTDVPEVVAIALPPPTVPKVIGAAAARWYILPVGAARRPFRQ
jgi:acetyltransferase